MNPDFKNITEWQPTPFSAPLLLVLFLIPIMVLLFTKPRIELETGLLMLVTLIGMLTGFRYFPYFILMWSPLTEIKIDTRLVKGISIMLLIISALGLYTNGLPPTQINKCESGITQAVDFIKDRNYQRVLNHYNFGGYMIYRDVPVFIDGRADMYGQVYKDHTDLIGMRRSPEDILDKYRPEAIFLPADAPLIKYLKLSGWKDVYADEKTVILEKGV